eukprot:COSAG01_NODE_41463_length_451_cov_0.880682_2_plen_82_part_01
MPPTPAFSGRARSLTIALALSLTISRARAQTGKVEVVTRVFALRSVKAGKADPALFPTRSPCVMSHDDGHGQGAPPCCSPRQ